VQLGEHVRSTTAPNLGLRSQPNAKQQATTAMSLPIVPVEFLCPITMELMVHPMTTKHGRTYEREAICTWMTQGHSECPLTRKPLRIGELIHNNYLVAEIQKWCELHGVPNPRQAHHDCESDDDDETIEATSIDLRHIYGTSIVSFKAVQLAPGYQSRNNAISRHDQSSLLHRNNKRRVGCSSMQSLQKKSFGFLSVYRIKA
jgi:U-box domain